MSVPVSIQNFQNRKNDNSEEMKVGISTDDTWVATISNQESTYSNDLLTTELRINEHVEEVILDSGAGYSLINPPTKRRRKVTSQKLPSNVFFKNNFW